MNRLLIATKNPGKLLEFKNFLSGLNLEIVSLKDVGIEDDVEENGKTYEENSVKKALYYAGKSGLTALSDDGGIEISALNNEPGVRSRRWLGYEATDRELIEHMKKVSENLPDDNRTAYFRTVITIAKPTGQTYSVMGEVRGIIAKKPHLKLLEGYPYRSFFYLPEIKKYYHESDLSEDEQKLYNHRYKAIQKLLPIIEKELNNYD
jgi:XTP/dITP diphosphohydrolase